MKDDMNQLTKSLLQNYNNTDSESIFDILKNAIEGNTENFSEINPCIITSTANDDIWF